MHNEIFQGQAPTPHMKFIYASDTSYVHRLKVILHNISSALVFLP